MKSTDDTHEITGLLALGSQDPELEKLMERVYPWLHRQARSAMRRERGDHTLQPTALVNEVYLRLSRQRASGQDVKWIHRAHFRAAVSRLMRQVLVDHARAHGADKRGGGVRCVSLDDEKVGSPPDIGLIALDEALLELERLHARQSAIVELRYFGGLTIAETADALGVSKATVKVDWAMAKAWLRRRLEGEAAP